MGRQAGKPNASEETKRAAVAFAWRYGDAKAAERFSVSRFSVGNWRRSGLFDDEAAAPVVPPVELPAVVATLVVEPPAPLQPAPAPVEAVVYQLPVVEAPAAPRPVLRPRLQVIRARELANRDVALSIQLDNGERLEFTGPPGVVRRFAWAALSDFDPEDAALELGLPKRAGDMLERMAILEEENRQLRDKALTEAGAFFRAPARWRLTVQEQACLGVLMARELCPKVAFMTSLYGLFPEDDEPEIKIVDVFICKLRKKLDAFEIEIGTRWGQGYFMLPAMKDKVRGIIADLETAGEMETDGMADHRRRKLLKAG